MYLGTFAPWKESSRELSLPGVKVPNGNFCSWERKFPMGTFAPGSEKSLSLSYAYIGPKSRTERPRKNKIGTEVVHVTHDSDTTFKVKRSKVNLQGTGHIVAAYHTAFFLIASAVHIRRDFSRTCQFADRRFTDKTIGGFDNSPMCGLFAERHFVDKWDYLRTNNLMSQLKHLPLCVSSDP